MRYKCIIFDCDGVLVDSEEISNKVLIEMAESVGATIKLEYARSHFSGKSLKNIFKLIENLASKPVPSNFEDTYRKRSFELFKTDLQAINGIYDLLDKISIPYGVASNGPIDKIRLNLTITKLIDKFEHKIFSAYEIGSWKPNPKLFVHAAKTMGFSPKECVVIEDSLAGIKAAKAGGFDVFGFANKSNQKAFKEEGAKVFFEMEKLYDLLSETN